jgi:heavy metal sensor kinase
LFSLGALVVVLAGFSTTLYLLARTYLYRQADDRLEASLNILVAAADIGPDGVEWEPHQRRLSMGGDPDAVQPQLLWAIADCRGHRVDGSRFPPLEEFLAHSTGEPIKQVLTWRGERWWVSQRSLLALSPSNLPVSQWPSKVQNGKYSALIMTAAVPLEPVQTALRNLALALAGTSVGVWLLASLAARWLCRRALMPVTQMAATARSMGAANLEQRLPSTGTADELDELGRAFNGLLDRLHESFERQRRFTGDASHQLRTPLTAILGQIEVALRRDRSADEYERVLTSVQGQALHLRQIVEMLLFLARADAEARLPHLEIIDVADWLRKHLQEWSGHARAADLRFERPPDARWLVEAQVPLLGQLVDNLLENACKYSEPGTPITIRLGKEKGQVLLTVEDQGCGIAPEDLPHVFEPFFRAGNARRLGLGGVGLGLAVAQRIAAAFRGTVGVESVAGHGSRFTLWLPQARVDDLGPPGNWTRLDADFFYL